ncbi:PPE family protein [Nocardia cyriacigeorgica]|nr:PPE family protein [Nocardia cyriacigeorgica]MBF6093901.1 PPE family protein [Nocardia cyriacigeorgica]MBF6398099.1 PPE family protein [Nocardia cyriacigeorgica]MBF6404387.1 PPE family protein [Nocardia cyriacigeorgica]
MIGAATSYRALAETLRVAASSSDGHTAGLANTWQGDTANKALAAYRRHTDWLRQQAQHADMIAERCMTQARLYEAARAEMPHYAEIAANRARSAALATASGTAVGMAAFALNEAEYAAMAAMAVHAMVTYAAGTAQNAVFPPPEPAPHIAAPGAGGGGGPLNLLPGGGGPRASEFGRGPGETGGGGSERTDGQGPSGPRPGDPGSGGSSDPGGTGPSDPGSGPPGTSETAPSTGSGGPADSLPGEGQLPPGDPVAGPETLGEMPIHGPDGIIDPASVDSALFGTTPGSRTLEGLTGGVGSSVALGLARGGLGGMPGAATGFRMPTNWTLRAPGATFGAPVTPAAAPPARKLPPRGAIAPNARRRRRDREELRKPAAVFTAGETQEVPVLEKPPAIGVIEYHDDDTTSQHKEVLGEPVRG